MLCKRANYCHCVIKTFYFCDSRETNTNKWETVKRREINWRRKKKHKSFTLTRSARLHFCRSDGDEVIMTSTKLRKREISHLSASVEIQQLILNRYLKSLPLDFRDWNIKVHRAWLLSVKRVFNIKSLKFYDVLTNDDLQH